MAIIGFLIGMFIIMLVIVLFIGGVLFKLLIGGICFILIIAIAKTNYQTNKKILLIAITVILALAIVMVRDYFP